MEYSVANLFKHNFKNIYTKKYTNHLRKKKIACGFRIGDVLQMQKIVDKRLQEQYFRAEIGSASNILERLIFFGWQRP